jgi:hypothetical protein
MVEINDYFCPNENCKCYGLRGQGNLVKAGKYRNDGVARRINSTSKKDLVKKYNGIIFFSKLFLYSKKNCIFAAIIT